MTLVISWCHWVLLFLYWNQMCLTLSTVPQLIFIYPSIFPLRNFDKWYILMVMNKLMSSHGKLMVWRNRNVLYILWHDEQLSLCPHPNMGKKTRQENKKKSKIIAWRLLVELYRALIHSLCCIQAEACVMHILKVYRGFFTYQLGSSWWRNIVSLTLYLLFLL